MPGPGANTAPALAGNNVTAFAPRAASVPAADFRDDFGGLHARRRASSMHNLTIAWLDEAAPPEVAALGPDELQALITQTDEAPRPSSFAGTSSRPASRSATSTRRASASSPRARTRGRPGSTTADSRSWSRFRSASTGTRKNSPPLIGTFPRRSGTSTSASPTPSTSVNTSPDPRPCRPSSARRARSRPASRAFA